MAIVHAPTVRRRTELGGALPEGSWAVPLVSFFLYIGEGYSYPEVYDMGQVRNILGFFEKIRFYLLKDDCIAIALLENPNSHTSASVEPPSSLYAQEELASSSPSPKFFQNPLNEGMLPKSQLGSLSDLQNTPYLRDFGRFGPLRSGPCASSLETRVSCKIP